MLPATGFSMEERPRVVLLRVLGTLLLIGGMGVSVWLFAAGGGAGWRVVVMLLAPGVILLFAAWLAENTPSMRGCLTLMALILAAMAAFWAYVAVVMARAPEEEPPPANAIEAPAPAEEPVVPLNDGPAGAEGGGSS